MPHTERRLKPTSLDFVSGESVPAEPVHAIEGAAEQGGKLAIKPLMVGDDTLVIESTHDGATRIDTGAGSEGTQLGPAREPITEAGEQFHEQHE